MIFFSKQLTFLCFYQLGKRLLICAWTASESLLTTALASKGSWFSMLWAEALVQVLAPFYWNVCQWTMARSPSSGSLSTPLHRFQPLLLSPTTVSSRPTPSWNTLMLLCCWITRPFMTYAGAPLTLSVLPIPTLTAWFLRYCSYFTLCNSPLFVSLIEGSCILMFFCFVFSR